MPTWAVPIYATPTWAVSPDTGDADRGVIKDQFEQAKSLEGAIMPNGQKYEDWLKDKEGGKND